MRYIDLMGGQKPHLLVETRQQPRRRDDRSTYAPSTNSICRTSAPARRGSRGCRSRCTCVEKVDASPTNGATPRSPAPTAITTATSTASSASSAASAASSRSTSRILSASSRAGNAHSPYITDDKTLYQPPVKTITWFHTGAFIERRLARSSSRVRARVLHEPAVCQENAAARAGPAMPATLTADEWREALRACKGMTLRQEVYELDVDALRARRAPAGAAVLHRVPQLPHPRLQPRRAMRTRCSW